MVAKGFIENHFQAQAEGSKQAIKNKWFKMSNDYRRHLTANVSLSVAFAETAFPKPPVIWSSR